MTKQEQFSLTRYGSDPAPLMIKTGDTESDYEVVDHKDYLGAVDVAQLWREAGGDRRNPLGLRC